MNRATEIIVEFVRSRVIAEITDVDWRQQNEVFTPQQAKELCDGYMMDFSEEYDQDWFSIIAVPGSRSSVAWHIVAAHWTLAWDVKRKELIASRPIPKHSKEEIVAIAKEQNDNCIAEIDVALAKCDEALRRKEKGTIRRLQKEKKTLEAELKACIAYRRVLVEGKY